MLVTRWLVAQLKSEILKLALNCHSAERFAGILILRSFRSSLFYNIIDGVVLTLSKIAISLSWQTDKNVETSDNSTISNCSSVHLTQSHVYS